MKNNITVDNLSHEEICLIGQAASDLESGNHLIRKRSEQQRNMMNEVLYTLLCSDAGENLTDRQKSILHVYRMHIDFDYFNDNK